MFQVFEGFDGFSQSPNGHGGYVNSFVKTTVSRWNSLERIHFGLCVFDLILVVSI